MQVRYPFTLLALMIPNLLACGSEDPAPAPAGDELLAPPPAGRGVQFVMKTKLDPGSEAEHCMFVQAPPEGLFVSRDEVRFNEGSHHVLLYETPYTTIPTTRDDGSPLEQDANGVFDCSDGAAEGLEVTKLVAGSQNADGNAFVRFPEGVAMPVTPGRVLLINAHYINASSKLLEPEVRINLHTIPEEEVVAEGDILFWYNLFIKVDAQSESRARMRCMLHSDITLINVQSHMHARGTDYAASEAGAEPFYTNDAWENVPVKDFGDGMELAAGTWLDYQCDYTNTGATAVVQGPRSTDEMCMLIGAYYPADRATSRCVPDPEEPDERGNFGAEWVGNGQATCAETFTCIQQALGGDDSPAGISTCVNASDPAVSKEMSDALRCLLMNFQDAPNVCQSEFDACMAK